MDPRETTGPRRPNAPAATSADPVVQRQVAALRVYGMYPRANPNVGLALGRLRQALSAFAPGEGIQLDIGRDQIWFGDLTVLAHQPEVRDLASRLYLAHVVSLVLLPEVTADELMTLFDLLRLPPEERAALGPFDHLLSARGVRHAVVREAGRTQVQEEADEGGAAALLARAGIDTIRVTGVAVELGGEIMSVFEGSSFSPAEASRPDVARSRYHDSKAVLAALVEAARTGAGTASRMLRTVALLVEKRLTERESVAELLARLREHHELSWRHALDGAVLSVLLGRVLGLGGDRLVMLGEAAALRDVGKLAVARDVLDAPEASDSARAEYRRHPVEGAKLLLHSPEVGPAAAIVALEHHVGVDRRGFPAVRAGRSLHPFSRLVAVAAAYDRLAGERAGDARLPPAEALRRLLQGAGGAYDAAAVRALLALVGLVPEGTAVKLKDGSSGVVAGIGERHFGQPDVVLLRDAQGREVGARIVRTSDLAAAGETAVTATGAPTRDDAERLKPLARLA